MLKPLRPHQQYTLDQLKRSIVSGKRSPMLQLPTGAGKTVLAAHIVDGILAKKNRLAFCVPSISLIDQTADRFMENGIGADQIGIIQADHPWTRPAAPIQICSAQTMARRDLPAVDVVVIDEAHLRFKVYDEWMTGKRKATSVVMGVEIDADIPLFIGLSATPWAKGLGKNFDDLIKSISLAELIEQGYLSKFRVYAPSKPDLSGVKIVAGDYHEGQLGEVMNEAKLVGDVVQNWLAHGKGLPTLCFAVNRLHARSLHDAFEACGISSAYVDANTPREERDQIGRDLEAGRLAVAVNIGTLTTGIDWDVRCIILARPTRSEQLFVQIIGRGLRTADGKDECKIFDHTNTTNELGFVTQIDHDELDDGTRGATERKKRKQQERKAALPKDCPACAALMPTGEPKCLVCGTEMPRPKALEHAEGELVELDEFGNPLKGRGGVKPMLRKKGRQQVYSELLGYAIKKGNSSGWVAHTYREIFDAWPNRQEKHPLPVSPEVMSYIRHKNIRWAKSREAKNAA